MDCSVRDTNPAKKSARYHRLQRGGATYDFETLHAIIGAAVTARARDVTVGLDGINLPDADVVRELIRGSRRIRAVGGSLRLHVTRPDVLAALRTFGLEKIFEIVAD